MIHGVTASMWSKLTRGTGNKVQPFTDVRTAASNTPTGRPSSPRIRLSEPLGQPRKASRPNSAYSAPSKEDEDPPMRRLKKHRLKCPTAGDLRNFSVMRKRV